MAMEPLAGIPTPPRCGPRPAGDGASPAVAGPVCLFGIAAADPAADCVLRFDGRPVQRITAGPLSALVAAIDPARFDAAADQLVGLAVAHHDIVAILFQDRPLLPARFGTVLRSADIVRSLLLTHEDALGAELQRLEGLQEWVFRLFVEETAAPTSAAPPPLSGTAFLTARREARSARLSDQRDRADLLSALLAVLARSAKEIQEPVRLPGSGYGVKVTGLLAADKVDAAVAAARETVAAAAPGVRLAVDGPWPPFSFVRMSIHG